jgi:hypothetical protein
MDVKKFLENIKPSDSKILNIVKIGLEICFVLCLISILILSLYDINFEPYAFYIGTLLFKNSLVFSIAFVIGGIAFMKIEKDCE